MGNQLAAPQKQGLDNLSEVPKIVLKDTLGGGRFLKTLQCVHDEGGLVAVKVYYKRGESPALEPYGQQLLTIRNKMKGIDCPHVWPFQYIQESPSAAYLMRQYLFSNLYDRLSTRPFLSNIEKRWITYQLMQAVAQSHERGVCHGDIKCENVLLTSWHWLFLVDFACYKPAMLPADNPADFSFFFDTGGRRRCYLAPERFYEGSAASANSNAALHPAMDIFSLGCVIAEIFLDGQALFDLSQLLAYRRNEYDPTATLAAVDPDMRRLILDMIQLPPDKRWSADNYLKHWSPALFPPHFDTLLHPFFDSMLRKDTDARMATVWKEFGGLVRPELHSPSSDLQNHKGVADFGHDAGGNVPGADEAGGKVEGGHVEERDAMAPSQEPTYLPPSVESLLAAAQNLAAHVDQLTLDVADDGGFLLDDGAEAIASEELGKTERESFRAAEAAQVDEVVLEEVHEYQLHEEGQWVMDRSGSLPMGTPRVHRKEDVKLPPGGWQWADEWHVDFRGHPCDSSGWQYRQTGRDGGDASGWSSECTQSCVWRRRCWKRSRKRSINTKGGRKEGVSHSRMSSQPLHADLDELVKSESVVLIAVFLCTLLRGSKLQQSKRYAIQLLCEIAMLCDDELKLQCVVPHLLALVSEPCANVRALALRCLVKLVSSAKAVAASDSKVFQDYILPSLSLLPNDEEESVRVEYALGIAQLAAAAHLHLKRLYSESHLAVRADPSNGQPFRYEQEMAAVRGAVEKVVLELITGQRSSAEVKRGMLSHVQPLALFFGRRELNDLLLPLLITCLNANEWQLRSTFFRSIASIGTFTGKEALDVFLLPCLEQALVDVEPSVVADAVSCLAQVTQHLRKRSLMAAASRVAPLLHHVHPGVRVSAVGFIATAARMLPLADVYTQLLQLLDGMLVSEPILLSDEVILASALKAPGTLHHEESVVAAAAAAAASVVASEPPLFSHLFLPPNTTPTHTHTPRSNSSRGTFSENRKPNRHRRAGSGLHPSHSSAALTGTDEAETELMLRPNAPTYTVDLETSQMRRGSLHSIAVAGLPSKINSLRERAQSLHDKLSKDPASVDLAEVQQLDKVNQTLAKLSQPPGSDVRDTATMNTWQLVRLATRTSPQQSELPSSAQHLAQSMLQPFPGDLPPVVANPGVSDDISAAISTGIIPASTTAFIDTTVAPWRPNGVLVAHLFEHRKGVNKLAVAKNGAFFVSGSNDETVKVWDLRRLEKDVSFHSQLTYAGQSGRILAVAAVEDDASVASASSNGSIHVWRVDYTRRPSGAPDKYTGVVGRTQLQPGEGAVLDMLMWGPQLLYVTQRGGVHGWDMRSGKDGWVLPAQPWMGLVENMVADPVARHWVLTGTSRGFMSLWDVRFILTAHCWQHPCRCPIDAMAPATAHPSCLRIQRSNPAVPLVYVAAGEAEVGLWDVAAGTCQQVLRVVNAGELDEARVDMPAALQQTGDRERSPTAMSSSLEEVHAQRPRGAGVRALLTTPSGPVITAGSDRCIRYWDSASPSQSYMVCGPIWPDSFDESQLGLMQVPSNQYSYTARGIGDVPVIEEYCLAESPNVSKDVGSDLRTKMRINDLCHNDAITHLTVANTSGGNKLLLSCSRDGCVKAWR